MLDRKIQDREDANLQIPHHGVLFKRSAPHHFFNFHLLLKKQILIHVLYTKQHLLIPESQEYRSLIETR